MTTYNLYTAPPTNLYANPDNAVTLGTEFIVNTRCWATQIRYYRATGSGTGTRTGGIYRVNTGGTTGALVHGPVTIPSAPDGSWAAVNIGQVELVPGVYRVAVHHPQPGLYVAQSNYYSTGPGGTNQTRGPITIPNVATALGQRQGTFTNSAALAFPNSVYNAGAYWVDVTVSDIDPNPPATPGLTVKVREGNTWVTRTARPKVRRGDTWQPAPLKHWTGTTWQ